MNTQLPILLLNPSYIDELYDFKQEFSVEYPLGLAYLAGTLEREGIEYDVLDANAHGYAFSTTVDAVVDRYRPRILGITSTTTTIMTAHRIAQEIKRRAPETIILLGGAHATAIPERSLQEFAAFDYIVQGDGELILAELCHTILDDEVQPHQAPARWQETSANGGVWFRGSDGESLHFQTIRQFKHLDEIPFPSRKKFDNERYRIGPLMNAGFEGIKLAKLAGSRGCPYQCNFCSEGKNWPPYRFRSPENIFKEMETCYHRDGARHFYFVDDTINVRTKHLLRLCQLIIDSGLDIKWHCHARVRPLNDELLTAMKASGCFGMMFGVESGDPHIIKNLGKNIELDHVRNGVRLAKKYHMKVLTFFMFGHIGETPETCQRTIDFARELTPDLAFFSMVTPFPGTDMWNYYLEHDALPQDFDWGMFKPHVKNALHHTPTMSGEEIWYYYNRAHRDYYLRPRYVGRVIRRLFQEPREIHDYMYLVREFLHTHEWSPSPINPGSGHRA